MARFGRPPLKWEPLPEDAIAPWACTTCGDATLLMRDYQDDKGCTYRKRKTCRACQYEKNRAYREAKPEVGRQAKWRNNFNLTPERHAEILASQGGACAICRGDNSSSVRDWHIDHDHSCCPQPGRSCGKCVRGLLCHQCNLMLGHAKDSIEKLMAAIRYLESFNAGGTGIRRGLRVECGAA